MEKKNKCYDVAAIFISTVAIIISIFNFKHNFNNGFVIDGQNFILSVLAILVTLLLGWQIFNVLNWENKLKKEVENEINKKAIEITKKIDITHNVIEKINTTIYEKTNMYLEYLKNEKEEKKINSYLEKIKEYTSEFIEPFSGGQKNRLINQINPTQAEMLLKEVKNLPKETQEKEEIKKLKEILERLKQDFLEF